MVLQEHLVHSCQSAYFRAFGYSASILSDSCRINLAFINIGHIWIIRAIGNIILRTGDQIIVLIIQFQHRFSHREISLGDSVPQAVALLQAKQFISVISRLRRISLAVFPVPGNFQGDLIDPQAGGLPAEDTDFSALFVIDHQPPFGVERRPARLVQTVSRRQGGDSGDLESQLDFLPGLHLRVFPNKAPAPQKDG